MLDNSQSNANARVDQSINLPDFFSCNNCRAGKLIGSDLCRELRSEDLCAKQMLADALRSGAVRIQLYISADPRLLEVPAR
jgi:hypothetical protein